MTGTSLITTAATDLTEFAGMPLPLALAVMTLLGSIATVVLGQVIKRFRTPQDAREDKVVVLDASDKLIERFQQIVKDSDEKHAKDIATLSAEVQTLRNELNEVKQERVGLLWGIRQLIRIARKYGGEAAQHEIDQLELAPSVTMH